jgi:hypothetical protein
MGTCCVGSKPFVSDNEGENFIREILQNLKLRHIDFSQIRSAYRRYEKVEDHTKDNQKRKIHLFEEEKFEIMMKDYYFDSDPQRNQYLKFQQALAPTYTEIWEKTRPEYSIYVNVLSILKNEKKEELIGEVIKPLFKELTYLNFQQFLQYYLEINLCNITKKIATVMKETKESISIDHRLLDNSIKKLLQELEGKDFTLENISLLNKKINSQMENIILGRGSNSKTTPTGNSEITNRSELENVIITEEHLKTLIELNPWLFDVIELRSYFFENLRLFKK